MAELVTIIEQRPVRGCIIVVEALILGFVVGGLLWVKVHPVVAIVAGTGACSFYAYLFTLRRVARVLGIIVSLCWAFIGTAVAIAYTKKGSHIDWLWGTFGAAVAFYISWRLHSEGAAELRGE